ncbi:hypothetical protein ACW5WN_12980 [Aeromonas lacus]
MKNLILLTSLLLSTMSVAVHAEGVIFHYGGSNGTDKYIATIDYAVVDDHTLPGCPKGMCKPHSVVQYWVQAVQNLPDGIGKTWWAIRSGRGLGDGRAHGDTNSSSIIINGNEFTNWMQEFLPKTISVNDGPISYICLGSSAPLATTSEHDRGFIASSCWGPDGKVYNK